MPWDDSQPRGTDKVCEGCIEMWLIDRFGPELDSEEEEEDMEREWRGMMRRGGWHN